ncbi:MAG: TonB-dependent receptor [Elusimicrobia bacterium]|nr:TonB-dependent receptor [Elusimicrobiota bacterium]
MWPTFWAVLLSAFLFTPCYAEGSRADPSPLELPDIVIRAERKKDKVSKRVVTHEELSRVAGSGGDPLKAIQALPGIAVANDSSSNPAIRGSAPQDNLYYVDNLPVGYLFHMGDTYSIFNPDLVGDFHIHPSAFGPEFHNATGGVIDITLREPRRDHAGVKINMSTLESDLLVEGPINKNQSLLLGARRSHLDFLLPKTGTLGNGLDYVQFPKFYDYQGKYLWRVGSRHSLSFQINGSEDKWGLKIREDSSVAAHEPDLAGTITGKLRYHSQGLVWKSALSPSSMNTLSLNRLRSGFSEAMTLGHVLADFDQFYLNENLLFRPAENHELTLGGGLIFSRIELDLDIKFDPPSDFDPDENHSSAARRRYQDTLSAGDYALFLRDRWTVHPRLVLIGGGRTSYDDYLGGTFTEPRAGTEFTLSETILLTAGWGRYHQFPEGHQVIDVFGNRDLSHFKAEHGVAGLERKLPDGWTCRLDGYYKTYDDLVVPDPVKTYVNGGSGSATGLEFLLKKEETAKWSGWLAVSQARSKRRNDRTGQDINFKYDQPLIINLVGHHKVSKTWSVGAKWRFNTGSPYTPVIGTYYDGTRLRPLYAGVNSARLPDYHRLDLRVDREWKFNTWTLSSYIEVINLYSRRNIGGYSYNADYSSRKPIHQLPTIPAFGLTAKF